MRFDKTYCSNCGREFGPGDHGFSHCYQHPGWKRDQMLKRKEAAERGWQTRRLRARGDMSVDQIDEQIQGSDLYSPTVKRVTAEFSANLKRRRGAA